jgi:hypothetical protein
VADANTCRRHCESKHAQLSRPLTHVHCRVNTENGCKKVSFVSKLAGDVATRKLKAEQSQRIIDGHLVERNWLTEMLRIQTNSFDKQPSNGW